MRAVPEDMEAVPEDMPPVERLLPGPPAKSITMQLVMENSLAKEDMGDYKKMDAGDAFEKATSLKSIHLEWQNVREIANLDMFDAAEALYLQYNCIERIEGLECLMKLQFLALQHNRISKIENLNHLRELEFLELSNNRIAHLDEKEIPISVNTLALRENPCAKSPGYQDRLVAHLPDLICLDGAMLRDVDDLDDDVPSAGQGATLGTGGEETADEQGQSAYHRKDTFARGVAAEVHNLIEAYSMEALEDVEGFTTQVQSATERSRARREGFRATSTARLSSSLTAAQLADIRRLSASLKQDPDGTDIG